MHIKLATAFVEAAHDVFRLETSLELKRGDLHLLDTAYTTEAVTVIISLVGDVAGTVVYSFSEAVALAIVARLLGEPVAEFDNLAQSGIAEIANVIAGRACVKFSEMDYHAKISPPTMLVGAGVVLSTLDLPRLVVPMTGEVGTLTLHLALRENLVGDQNPQFRRGTAPLAAPVSG